MILAAVVLLANFHLPMGTKCYIDSKTVHACDLSQCGEIRRLPDRTVDVDYMKSCARDKKDLNPG